MQRGDPSARTSSYFSERVHQIFRIEVFIKSNPETYLSRRLYNDFSIPPDPKKQPVIRLEVPVGAYELIAMI